MGVFPMKRLNRLRKPGAKEDLTDYFQRNLRQNWKAIEDTFSAAFTDILGQGESITAAQAAITALQGAGITAAVGGSTGLYSTTSSSFVTPTNCSLSMTTTKANLLVGVVPGDASGSSNLGVVGGSGEMIFRQDTTTKAYLINATGSTERQSAFGLITGVSAGSHTFDFQVRTTGAGTFFVYGYRLFILELPI